MCSFIEVFHGVVIYRGGGKAFGTSLGTHNDVVDGDVYKLDEEANKSHDGEPNRCGHGDLLELLPVRLGAALDQPDGVL